jgi:hypothetical protein
MGGRASAAVTPLATRGKLGPRPQQSRRPPVVPLGSFRRTLRGPRVSGAALCTQLLVSLFEQDFRSNQQQQWRRL